MLLKYFRIVFKILEIVIWLRYNDVGFKEEKLIIIS